MSDKSTGSLAGLSGTAAGLKQGGGLAEFSRQLTHGNNAPQPAYQAPQPPTVFQNAFTQSAQGGSAVHDLRVAFDGWFDSIYAQLHPGQGSMA